MKNEYNSALDALRFSQEDKARMVDSLLAAEEPAAKPRGRRRFRAAALVAAAVVVLGVGAGATGLLKTAAEAFSDVFGGSPAQTEIVDKIGRPVGASVSAGGVTITADAIIGDRYSYAVVYSITRDDGAPFDLEPNELGYLPVSFASQDTDVGNMGGAHGSAYTFDADPEDGSIQYVEMMTVDNMPSHATARVRFQDLCVYSGQGEREVLVQGEWKLKFEMDYEDVSISLPAGQTIDLGGTAAVVDGVTLSPVALRVDYTADGEVQWDDGGSGRQSEHDSAQMQKYLGGVTVLLTMTDGSVMDLTDRLGGGLKPKDGKTVCEKSGVFDQILQLDQVASVTVGGTVIPLR